jgi:hypothetical protein
MNGFTISIDLAGFKINRLLQIEQFISSCPPGPRGRRQEDSAAKVLMGVVTWDGINIRGTSDRPVGAVGDVAGVRPAVRTGGTES